MDAARSEDAWVRIIPIEDGGSDDNNVLCVYSADEELSEEELRELYLKAAFE